MIYLFLCIFWSSAKFLGKPTLSLGCNKSDSRSLTVWWVEVELPCFKVDRIQWYYLRHQVSCPCCIQLGDINLDMGCFGSWGTSPNWMLKSCILYCSLYIDVYRLFACLECLHNKAKRLEHLPFRNVWRIPNRSPSLPTFAFRAAAIHFYRELAWLHAKHVSKGIAGT